MDFNRLTSLVTVSQNTPRKLKIEKNSNVIITQTRIGRHVTSFSWGKFTVLSHAINFTVVAKLMLPLWSNNELCKPIIK